MRNRLGITSVHARALIDTVAACCFIRFFCKIPTYLMYTVEHLFET